MSKPAPDCHDPAFIELCDIELAEAPSGRGNPAFAPCSCSEEMHRQSPWRDLRAHHRWSSRLDFMCPTIDRLSTSSARLHAARFNCRDFAPCESDASRAEQN